MKLESEFIRLPYHFDTEQLKKEVASFKEEDWRAHPSGFSGNLALPLISLSGKMNDDFNGPMKVTRFMEQCPYIMQIFEAFGEIFGRSRLMRLEGGCEVPLHSDINYHWYKRVRIHIPIITNPDVTFYCGDEHVHMGEGEAWIFDAWKMHRVHNASDQTRIHLVVDTMGSAKFWDIASKSTHIEDRRQGTQEILDDQFVPYRKGSKAVVLVERFNAPLVMLPGEVDELVEDLISDVEKNPDNDKHVVNRFNETLNHFRWEWRKNWALYGQGTEGWPYYQALIDNASEANNALGGMLLLASNLAIATQVFRARVLVSALNTDLSVQYRDALANPRKATRTGSNNPSARREPSTPVPGRNAPCSCGSGKKYKRCCGR